MKPTRHRRKFGSLRARHRHVFLRRLTVSFIFIFLAFTLSVWLVNRPQFGIKTVEITGVSSYQPLELESAAARSLSGFYAGLVPRSLSFIYPKKEIVQTLLKEFRAVKEVSIERYGFEALLIRVVERDSDALWCRTEKVRDECYVMDSKGLVFRGVRDQSEKEELGAITYYGFLDSLESPVGAVYLSPERLSEIKTFLGTLKGIGFAATSFERTEDKEYHVILERGSRLILKEDVDFSHALSNLSSLLGDPELKALFEQTPLPFEYIDLRLPSKVFYRRK